MLHLGAKAGPVYLLRRYESYAMWKGCALVRLNRRFVLHVESSFLVEAAFPIFDDMRSSDLLEK